MVHVCMSRMAATGYVPPAAHGGRDGERIGAMQLAVREVAAAAFAASRALCDTAAQWREQHARDWRGGHSCRSQFIPDLLEIHLQIHP